MIIQSYGDSVPIIVFKNILKQSHIEAMLKDIAILNSHNHIVDGSQTKSAKNDLGEEKNNTGVFLDDLYASDRSKSNILSVHSNIINVVMGQHLQRKNIVFDYYKHTNSHSTLLSVYLNGQSYFSHYDESVLTSVTFLWNEPKKFRGGNIVFEEYGIDFQPEQGDVIIFPGFCKHEVSEVGLTDNTFSNGRYSISQFFNIR